MDLLDSIMSKMDTPPVVKDQHTKLLKEQQKAFEEAKAKEKERLDSFIKLIEDRVNTFMQSTDEKLKFEPMDRVERSVVRDVAEVAGLTSYAFGAEEVDRHIMVFKKEYPLCDNELYHYRNGLEWDPIKARLMEQQKAQREKEELLELKKSKNCPNSHKFVEKFEKIVGKETGRNSARVLEANEQFGLVRSELKKDKRTIEETLADIRAKKKKKLDDSSSQS